MAPMVINAVAPGLETGPGIMRDHGEVPTTVDHVILAVFVVEIVLRMVVHRRDSSAIRGA